MISEGIEALLAFQIAVALSVLAVFALRRPIRQWLGPRLAFGLWVLPVVAGLAVLAPGPIEWVPTSEPEVQAVPEVPAVGRTLSEADQPQARPAAHRSLGIELAATGPVSLKSNQVWLGLWVAGGLAMALILAVRQLRFYASLRPMQRAPELGPDVFRAGSTSVGAGLVGAARPKIIVPADFEQRFDAQERALILDHEREHRRAGHAQFNAIAALIQTLCWMNPVVHIGLRWFRLDQELACDAAILQRSKKSARLYGAALLRAQTGLAAPFGCTWRPANGLKTRIKALGMASPSALTRAAGGAGLVLLIAGVGAVSWAARPEMQSVAQTPVTLTGAPSEITAQSPSGELKEVVLRGVDGFVTIIAEPRSDVLVEGLAGQILTQREGSTMIVRVSELTRDICNQTASVGQDFTLRVPEHVRLDVEGRMNARIFVQTDVSLIASGCGSVEFGNLPGALTLELGGSLAVNGGEIVGPFRLDSSGNPSVDLVSVDREIDLHTAGGTSIDIEAVAEGGRFELAGGSTLDVEEWRGSLQGSLSGGSDVDIEAIASSRAEMSVSGAANGDIETGTITELRVDQAASADFFFGGRAERTRVRNRGNSPVVIARPGALDSQGRVRTSTDPPGD